MKMSTILALAVLLVGSIDSAHDHSDEKGDDHDEHGHGEHEHDEHTKGKPAKDAHKPPVVAKASHPPLPKHPHKVNHKAVHDAKKKAPKAMASNKETAEKHFKEAQANVKKAAGQLKTALNTLKQVDPKSKLLKGTSGQLALFPSLIALSVVAVVFFV